MSKLHDRTEITRAERVFYSDFFTDFSRHAITGELNKKTNEDSVKQSLRNLLLTNKYERLFHPEIGSGLSGMLFENATTQTQLNLETYVENVFTNYETRAILLGVAVNVKHDQNTMDVTIRFRLINSAEPLTLNLILERKR